MQDRRRWILQILAELNGFTCNHSVLLGCLELCGHIISNDLARTEAAWLEEQGLVTLQHHKNLTVLTLTERGLDIASGKANCPGITPLPPKV